MDRQPSILRSANTMIGAAALESIRPVRQPRFDSFILENARPAQEAAPETAVRSEAETPPRRVSAVQAGGSAPPARQTAGPPRQFGGETAATGLPDSGNETRVFKSAAPVDRIEQISPAAESLRPGGAPARHKSDAAKTPAHPDLVSAAAVKEPESILPPDSAKLPRSAAPYPGVMYPGQSEAIDAPLAKAAPALNLTPAASKQTAAAVSEPPEIGNVPLRQTGNAPNQHSSSLEALSALLNSVQRKSEVRDVSARSRDMSAHEAGMRAGPPQVHIGTLEVRIEGPAPAKAPPVRAPLPPSGPGIVSRLRLRSL